MKVMRLEKPIENYIRCKRTITTGFISLPPIISSSPVLNRMAYVGD